MSVKTCKTELLAPAKNKDIAIDAINCGADAVYIGAPSFGARHNAGNTLEDIKSVVDYAHKFWVKVHVTVNTILTDKELDEAVNMVIELSKIGVDAIIIQDMGLLERLIQIQKTIKLPQIHISTQCDNYLQEKIKFFNEIGVTRVVLARELSIEQIKEIRNICPKLELESFIHGALCVSMSGQCYLSQYIGGRSANRGMCAQPCRKKYSVIDSKGNIIKKDFYALCLKDFNASEHIDELINAGVCSFKIEGRLKDSDYVKNIVSYYRNLIPYKTSSGKSFINFIPNPQKTFNRGFTDYFLEKRGECFNFESPKSRGEFLGTVSEVFKDGFIIKTDKTISNQDGLYFNDDGCFVNKFEKLKEGKIKIYPNHKINIKTGDKVFRNFDVLFNKSLQQETKRQIGIVVNVKNSKIQITDTDGVSVTMVLPKGEIPNNPQLFKDKFINQFSKTGNSDFYIKEFIFGNDACLPFLPISKINELRRNLLSKLMEKRIEEYNLKKVFQNNLSHSNYFKKELDYRANIHNKYAKLFYEKCGAEVKEFSFESNQPKRQVEIMRCKHCIKYALNMCGSKENLFLSDSNGKTYPLKFNCKNCEMSVLSFD